ncbi:MAG TPA: ComEC/Rec2 family competence protein [Chthoniobacteraceae bacterium]|nr:ComEC/Rec2 family competence protein [Chthoniobacteraceae bacterium]
MTPLRPRQPLVVLALAALAGVFAAELWEVPLVWPVAVSVLLALPLFTKWRSTWLCAALATASFFTLHTLRHYNSAAHDLAQEFAPGPSVVNAVGIVWSEPEKPKIWSRNTTCHFLLKLESLDHAGQSRAVNALIETRWAAKEIPLYGDRIRVTGSARNFAPATNPGQFDFTGYLRRQGIYSYLQASYPTNCTVESHGHGSAAQELATQVTSGIRHCLEIDMEDSPEISSLVESMVLGVRGETLDETKLYFQQTGTMHLFAVSGLNVAMLIMIAFFLLKPIGVGRRAVFFILLPALIVYALITGLSASCVRAGIMGALVLASYLVDRPPLAFNSLAGSAVLILGWDTEQLFSPGFQFSYVLVLVLLLAATRLQKRLLPLGLPDPFLPRTLWGWPEQIRAYVWRGATANFSVSFAAWMGSGLFTAGYFHLFSLSTVAANLIAVPISFFILALGLASVLTGWWAPSVAALFNNANWGCTKALLLCVKWIAAVPGGHTYVGVPQHTSPPACEITVLDTGPGAANFLRTRHAGWLIDCGHGYDYQRVVLPYLRSRGVNSIDGLILTHGDVQHIGGAPAALEDLAPGVLIDSPLKDRSTTRRKLHADLALAQRPKSIYERGEVIHLDAETALQVLFPPAGLDRSTADDKAFVLLLECAGTRVLFMSDSGFSTEDWLLAHEPGLRADILIKGQHAKDLSGTEDFLAAVQPQVIVSNRPDPFAKSDEEWARMVAARGIALFRQENSGAVTIELRPGGWKARGFVNGQTVSGNARSR